MLSNNILREGTLARKNWVVSDCGLFTDSSWQPITCVREVASALAHRGTTPLKSDAWIYVIPITCSAEICLCRLVWRAIATVLRGSIICSPENRSSTFVHPICSAGRQFSTIAGVAQLVEHNVANVVVVGSNPIARSLRTCRFSLSIFPTKT